MDRLLGGLLALALYTSPVAWALPVFDGDFDCLDATTANRYVSDFQIDSESFGGLELCQPQVDTKKLLNDLQLVELGQFNGSTVNIFIQEFVPAGDYYLWLKEQTNGISRGDDIPWATAYNSGGYFTMQDGWAKLSTLGRVGTLIHEARHTEGYYHTICDHGPYKDSRISGCDESVASGGSHGVEMEYYARVVLQGANFHPVYQSMARLMLLARANFVFNESPMSEKDALIARTSEGLARLAGEDKQLLSWSFPGSESFQLKRTSLGATLLDLPNGAWSIDLERPDIAPALSDDYSYFKLLKMAPPADLVDVEEVDIHLRRYMYAIDGQERIYNYIFGQGAWSPATHLPGVERLVTHNPMGQPGLFAVFKNLTYCPIQVPFLRCDRTPMPWPADARKFVSFNGSTLKLGPDRMVYDSKGEVWDGLGEAEVLDLTLVPHFEIFQ